MIGETINNIVAYLFLALTSVQKEFPHLKAKLRWWDEFRKCTLLFLLKGVDKRMFALYNQYVRRNKHL